ncbi:MAG TPA: hypothetical protein VGE26_04730 [Sphingobacteriaceae bacterium]
MKILKPLLLCLTIALFSTSCEKRDTNISALPEFLKGYAGKLGQVLPALY